MTCLPLSRDCGEVGGESLGGRGASEERAVVWSEESTSLQSELGAREEAAERLKLGGELFEDETEARELW